MKNKSNIEVDSIKISSDLTEDPPLEDKGKKPKKHLTKKQKIIIVISVVLALAIGASVFAYFKFFYKVKKRDLNVKTVNVEPLKPKTLPSPLTGVEVSPDLAKRPIISVVIENLYPNARPQSSLTSAGVVYEALAEGGITRYLAVYGDQQPKDIGPVRSLRTYFVDYGMEYNAPIMHAGGNSDALDLANQLGMKDLNSFWFDDYFRRINTKFAPHNLYIYSENLDKLLKDKGFNNPPDFPVWQRKDDTPSPSPNAANISIDFSYADYRASYKYNPDSNDYSRFLRNVADVDANTDSQIKAKNIAVIYIPTSYGITKAGESTVIMKTIGSGKLLMFMDGTVIEGTWQKDGHSARTKFFDANGSEIKLNKGQTWVEVVPLGKAVTYN
ncbi:MAG: DUF3048 domain-containing protein [bacterium]|nr:DUF3048 domain-containing protein [bacterium]